MKKIYILATAIFTILLTSCGMQDTAADITATQISNTWKLARIESDATNIELAASGDTVVYKFTSNGRLTIESNNENLIKSDVAASYIYDGSSDIHIRTNGGNYNAKIKTLNSTSFIFENATFSTFKNATFYFVK